MWKFLLKFFLQQKKTFKYGIRGGRGLWDCGHVTGRVWMGPFQTSKGAGKHCVLSHSLDLAKLNTECYELFVIICNRNYKYTAL